MKYSNHHDNDGNGDNVVRKNVVHKKVEEVVHKIQVVVADENEVHSNTFFYLII